MEAFVGTINTFGFQFAPKNWALAQGQIMAIAQNTALFSLLGTTYGGNGQTNFALPDMRGRLPLSPGQGPGLSPYVQGEVIGQEAVTAIITNLPMHNHTLNATTTAATTTAPGPTVYLSAPNGEDANLGAVTVKAYQPTPNTPLFPMTCGSTGGNQPLPIIQPITCVNFSVALFGIYPSRN